MERARYNSVLYNFLYWITVNSLFCVNQRRKIEHKIHLEKFFKNSIYQVNNPIHCNILMFRSCLDIFWYIPQYYSIYWTVSPFKRFTLLGGFMVDFNNVKKYKMIRIILSLKLSSFFVGNRIARMKLLWLPSGIIYNYLISGWNIDPCDHQVIGPRHGNEQL